MHWEEHGGDCCGMRHIVNFALGFGNNYKWDDRYAAQQLSSTIRDIFNDYGYEEDEYGNETDEPVTTRDTYCLCIEAVLTKEQSIKWEPILFAEGFKRVNKFVNGNTGNTLTIYHLVTG